MWISDALGRFHGDVNSGSLLVQPARCGIAKKHRQERTTGSASGSAVPFVLFSSAPNMSDLAALQEPVCTRVDLLPAWKCSRAGKGDGGAKEKPLNYFRVIIW